MKRRLALTAALLTAFGLVGLAWPRGGRLELYTSPVMRIGTKSCRVQMLAPRGWAADALRYLPSFNGASVAEVRLHLRRTYLWAPAVVRRILASNEEANAELSVVLSPFGSRDPYLVLVDDPYTVGGRRPPRGRRPMSRGACCGMAVPCGFATITYIRSDLPAFEATYRQILNSVRVIQ